ncbi:MAG: hypothetical protein V3V75_11325 [Thermoguttaceae bacterium]
MVDGTLTTSPPKNLLSGDLALRVRGSSRDGQIVRLRSRKCTIGSGPRCTLRLRARGVLPLHCLVVRGPAATIVRCWAPDTRLNGRDFLDAELTPGDTLSIGPVQLEVVAPAELDSRENDLQRQREQWETQQAENLLRSDTQSEEMQSQLAQLDTQREELESQRNQWQQQQTDLQGQLDQGNEQLDTRAAELDSRENDLQRQREQWDTQQAELRQQIEQRAEQLNTAQQELQQQRQQWTDEQAAADARSSERAEQLDAMRAELDTRSEQLQKQQVEMQSQSEALERATRPQPPTAEPHAGQDQAEQIPPEEIFEDSPEALAEVLPRVGGNDLPPTGEKEEKAPPQGQNAADAPNEQATTDSAGQRDKDEESVEEYMARLMQRISGVTAPRQPRPPERSEIPSVASPKDQADFPAVKPRRRKPVDLSPRAEAPEKHADMLAMRQLANVSAKTAIDRHTRRQMTSTKRGKLLVAVVSLLVGVMLAWMWWEFGLAKLTYYAALVSFLVALLWGTEYAIITGKMIINRSGHLDRKPPDDPPRQSSDNSEAKPEDD